MSYLVSKFPSSFSFLLLLTLISSHLLHTAFSYEFLSFKCNKESVAATDYMDNRAVVLEDLAKNTDLNGGYYSALQTLQSSVNITGSALCRGDVPPEDCRACISEAAVNINTTCNLYREGVIWYDYCSLKYSDQNFLGLLDTENVFSTYNTSQTVTSEVASLFDKATRELMNNLSTQAYNNVTAKFARGKQEFLQMQVDIYGMAQCTRDLSQRACSECLVNVLTELHVENAHGNDTINVLVTQGATYYTPNCMVRYETSSFLLGHD